MGLAPAARASRSQSLPMTGTRRMSSARPDPSRSPSPSAPPSATASAVSPRWQAAYSAGSGLRWYSLELARCGCADTGGLQETHPQAGHRETHPQAGHRETHPQAGHRETHPQAGHRETHPQAGHRANAGDTENTHPRPPPDEFDAKVTIDALAAAQHDDPVDHRDTSQETGSPRPACVPNPGTRPASPGQMNKEEITVIVNAISSLAAKASPPA